MCGTIAKQTAKCLRKAADFHPVVGQSRQNNTELGLLARLLRYVVAKYQICTGRIMTGQFVVGIGLFMLAAGLTANLWLLALQHLHFREVATFYKRNFLGLIACVSLLVTITIFMQSNFLNALLQGVTAAFVLFIIFAWGRLTALGLKFDLTYTQMPE